MGKLNTLSVKSIKKVGLHADGDGLYLKVQASPDPNQPNKSWIYRWGAGGKNTIGLGPVRDVSLADARELSAKQRQLIRQGIDPRQERTRATAAAEAAANEMTFAKAAEQYIETQRLGWKNAKHAQQWTNTITAYANPVIGKLPCSAVSTEQILEILTPIWTAKNETATRLRGRIETIFDWAAVKGLREGENPARWKGKLEYLLPTISKRSRVRHHSAMPYPQVPELFKNVGAHPSLSAKALLFCVLTASRTSETIKASWSEIDLENRLWTIPKERMKKTKEHRVPLSDKAVEVLKSIAKKDNSDWIFNGQSRKGVVSQPLTNMAMLNFLKKTLGHKSITVHGFRSSFRDWAGETTNHKREVIEQALAHQLVDQAEAAYQRGDYLEKRRTLMQDWAGYCLGIEAKTSAEAEIQRTSVT